MNEPVNKSITPANRVKQIKEYYFSRKLAEVAAMKEEGKDIVSLAIGGPDLPPSQDVITELCEEAKKTSTHSYQNTRGIPELRKAFADWYKNVYNVELNPSTELLPLIGSKEGITHISLTFLNPGDKVLIPNPGYPTYTSATKIVEAVPVYYSLSPENGWYPDFNELEKLVSENPEIKLMWINYPHMPTGTPARRDIFEKIVAFGLKHSIVIAHDNPYSFILNDEPLSILQIPGAKDICIEMNSLSKSHNMAGWRVAMLASNPTFVQWILKVKSNVDSGQFRPVMKAAVKALGADKDWYSSLNKVYSARRKVAEQIMNEIGCDFDSSQRGLFLWGKVPENVPSGEWLADKLLYEAGVFITPGFIFGSNGEKYIRISLCADIPQMEKALKKIRSYINENRKSE